jgi:SAM-dependent methyltransferase
MINLLLFSPVDSYSSHSTGLANLMREIVGLFHIHSNVADRVRGQIEDAKRVVARISERYGIEIRDLDVAEIGPGQFLTQLTYFAVHNRVTGVDRDVIVRGFRPGGYISMLRTNGARRLAKTLGRKALGVDREYLSTLKDQLGLQYLPPVKTHAMDVCRMSFPPGSFDFVYSRSVLHCLPDPVVAIKEIVRVMRPGGISYVTVQPYTSPTGCLDPRLHTNRRHEVEGWPHLRAGLRDGLQAPNVYLNKFRLDDWRRIFAGTMIGCDFILTPISDPKILDSAKKLRAHGELLDYSMEELTSGELVAMWRKPRT